MPQLSIHCPIDDLTITEEDGKIVSVDWGWSPFQERTPLLDEAKKQLDAYFDGELQVFNLPLNPFGTDHQKKVWDIMCDIPMGETLTYGDVAKKTGSAPQAVGSACGVNPIPIIIPCHRIIATSRGAKTRLGGYSGEGGTWTKKALLVLEGALPLDSI